MLGALESGHAVVYPSGMAAVHAAIRHVQPRTVSLPDDVYHGTRTLVDAGAARQEWEVGDDGDLVWVETPSNPKCLVTDIEAAVETAHRRGAKVVVDSTFATPVALQPLSLGADLVVHSTTKFINGHSDALGGVVVAASPEVASDLRTARDREGAVPGAFETWLTLRGVRTLAVRVERQSATALEVARLLEDHVPQVHYPGLASHPQHEIAARTMRVFGGVLSFELEDGARAAAVVDRLSVFRRATSLGGVESLAEHRLSVNPDAPPGLVRLSIGLEPVATLIADLEAALTTR